MKKLEELVKNKQALTTLILLGSYALLVFVVDLWNAIKYGFSLSTWIVFLVIISLVSLTIFGLLTKKREFVAAPLLVLGFYSIYSMISAVSGIQYFFQNFKHLSDNIETYKSMGYTVKVDVASIIGDLLYGVIGLTVLGAFVCFLLGKVVLKNEKLSNVANILTSLVPAIYVAYGLVALVSVICTKVWYNQSNTIVLCGSYADYVLVSCIASSCLWAVLACVARFGLPEGKEVISIKK